MLGFRQGKDRILHFDVVASVSAGRFAACVEKGIRPAEPADADAPLGVALQTRDLGERAAVGTFGSGIYPVRVVDAVRGGKYAEIAPGGAVREWRGRTMRVGQFMADGAAGSLVDLNLFLLGANPAT